MAGLDISAARSLMSLAKKVVITTHVSPDGDAIGSSLALSLYLNKSGFASLVITPDDYPAFLYWLPGNEKVIRYDAETEKAIKAINSADLIICLDFNSPDRLAKMQGSVEKASCHKILIDHHQNPVKWTDVLISEPAASSTSELVYRFIESLGGLDKLDKDIAACLYTGLITDTGSFKFPSTSPLTLRIAAKLMETGLEASKIQNLIYDNSTLDRLRLMGFALTEKLTIFESYNTAVMGLNAGELKRYNYRSGDTEGLVNYPLGIAGIKMSVFISDKNGEVRMSFRSKGKIPVHEIARKYFNGGGHINAAGGLSDKSVEDTILYLEQILPEFKEFLCD